MVQSTLELYDQYVKQMQRIADMRYAGAVLQWDQETYMPANGATARARQIATLSETAHELFTALSLENVLTELLQRKDLPFVQQRNIEITYQDIIRQKKLSSAFVRKMSETISVAFNAWLDARKQNSFEVFSSSLGALVELKRNEADMLGYEQHPYNALLYEYEKSITVNKLDDLFDRLNKPLRNLIDQVTSTQSNDDSFLHQHYPEKLQWEWGMNLIKQLGFDLDAGRQDISEHPFTTNFSAEDVRITTRIDEQDFANMTWSCIHEVGHALYEQGLSKKDYGLPSGEYASLSIHESQSRLWENCVGRSVSCWNHFLPELKKYFPAQLKNVEVNSFCKAINKVQPSLIRTEADELTYHFHVNIRYELEKELIGGDLNVKDIPGTWNELYHKKIGVTVPDDKRGCLQDVHWSHGSFGYFPTYSLGSFYAAQFWKEANRQNPMLNTEISNGKFLTLLQWLRTNIHTHGKIYDSEALCEKITGEKLNVDHFLEYAKEKFLGN